MFLADLHVHSTFSDGQMSIPDLVDFYGRRGFGAIAITDHLCENTRFLGKVARYLNYSLDRETFGLYREVIRQQSRRAWSKYRMRVIPGVEITKNSVANSRSAHILALGIDQYISADQEVEDICHQIRQQGGVSIAAHPVSTGKMEPQTYYLWDRRDSLKHHFDAWEVASGPTLFPQVEQSGLPVLATSDLHRASQIRSWKTTFACGRSWQQIRSAIREQQVGLHFYQEGI